MKSLLKPALILLFAIFCFTACEGPQGPPGVPGPPGQNGYAYSDVRYYEINSRQWFLANGYYFAEVAAPAITMNVLDKGAIVGYLVYNYNTGNEVQIPLPYDIYFYESNQGGILQWTETVSFEISLGKITFYYEPDDFNTTATTPPSCMFKVVAMW